MDCVGVVGFSVCRGWISGRRKFLAILGGVDPTWTSYFLLLWFWSCDRYQVRIGYLLCVVARSVGACGLISLLQPLHIGSYFQ